MKEVMGGRRREGRGEGEEVPENGGGKEVKSGRERSTAGGGGANAGVGDEWRGGTEEGKAKVRTKLGARVVATTVEDGGGPKCGVPKRREGAKIPAPTANLSLQISSQKAVADLKCALGIPDTSFFHESSDTDSKI